MLLVETSVVRPDAQYLLKNLAARKPASLRVAPSHGAGSKVPLDLRYIGFDIPKGVRRGCGLGYAERFRNLPYVATLKPKRTAASGHPQSEAGATIVPETVRVA